MLTFVLLLHPTVQESPGDGIRWSIMSLHGILYKDAGDYSCKAKNVAGNAEATISVSIAGTMSTTIVPVRSTVTGTTNQSTTFTLPTVTPNLSTLTSTATPKISTIPAVTKKPKTTPSNNLQKGSKQTKTQQESNGKKLPADGKSEKSNTSKSVKDLRIVEQTSDSAVLLWTADGLAKDTPLTVVYSTYGDEDDAKRTEETNAGSGKMLIEGLLSGTRYSICLIAKGSNSGKDPCIDFDTLAIIENGEEYDFFMIISGIACALVVPLIAFLIYKIIALYCKGRNPVVDEEELEKESYVKFETISMKQRTLNSHHPTELWARRATHESERMLLCSRSSIDSQMTYKSDSSRSEYLC